MSYEIKPEDVLFSPSAVTPSLLVQQVGAWADKNFDLHTHAPDFGVAEELGEAIHCVLKRMQGIRGFTDPVLFHDKFSDAMADAVVYLAHVCFKHNCVLPAPREMDRQRRMANPNLRVTFCTAFVQVGFLMSSVNGAIGFAEEGDTQKVHEMNLRIQEAVNNLFVTIESLCDAHNMNLWGEVQRTWHKVQQRDWRKNASNADSVVEQL